MRFLCDEMLQRLGRWLRAAGYDTEIAEPGMADRRLIERACGDARLLLTRDRKLAEFRQARDCLMLVAGNDVDTQALEIGRRLDIDWLHAPFSRCLLCNQPLLSADPGRNIEVPPFSRERATVLLTCSGCGKLYWDGSHVRRMRRKLTAWQTSR